MPTSPCPGKVSAASKDHLTETESAELLARMQKLASDRAKNGENYEEALKDIVAVASKKAEAFAQLDVRNNLLSVRARRNVRAFIKSFPTMGEGLIAFMEGSSKIIPNARLSVDAQSKAIHGQYLGSFIAELEQQDLLKHFKDDKLSKEIFIEMGELKEGGTPGSSGSKEAMGLAKIIERVSSEMVARQNKAGAAIEKIPGYIARQTHDMDEIRRLGGAANSPEGRKKSLDLWTAFTLPLLDITKTMDGADPAKFMRNVHESLYSGVHGPHLGEFESTLFGVKLNLSKKVSASRVLHFKDAMSAWKYNERFGTRSLRDQVFSDLFYRARSISLMENFGPSPTENFNRLLREIREDARASNDAEQQLNSLSTWKIQTLFDTVTGEADIPVNHSLAKAGNVTRAIAVLSKMGATVINALSDKAFMNHEFAYQGINRMDRWAKQFTGLMSTPEGTRQLRLMGVALDGIIGNTVARYTTHTTTAGKIHRLQQKMFDINFLNWWTDTNKGAAAQLMSAHLGEHADLPLSKLPEELSRVLSLYGIEEHSWDVLRKTAWSEESGIKHVTPDQIKRIPDAEITGLLEKQGRKDSASNRDKLRQELETGLRTYYSDRVDFAVPTPGASEKKWTHLGTRPGTPLGEAVRMIMLFKSFPIAVLTKLGGREVYGHGAMSVKDWLKNDHSGKFATLQLIAVATIAGYLSGAAKDALKGRTPKPLMVDGKLHMPTFMDAASRGGGAGILGDLLFNEYDRQYRTLTGTLLGPVAGQLDPAAEILTLAKRGEGQKALSRSGKMIQDNTPFINLFYIRPVLDYFIFWNLQEMMEPGSLQRIEHAVEEKNKQGFFMKPSERP